MENFETLQEFMSLIDLVYDEICIWDAEERVVYINNACCRHYGLRPEEFIGKHLSELCMRDRLWFPTVVMDTLELKKPAIQRQKTIMGQDITTISVPIFDSANNVKHIVQSVRDSYALLYKELSPIPQPGAAHRQEAGGLLYRSPRMEQLVQHCSKIAPTDAAILILGETGVGKSRLVIGAYRQNPSSRKLARALNVSQATANRLIRKYIKEESRP